jgi:phosphoglycerol transferase MdoB-like AlkP superfamily enzyme
VRVPAQLAIWSSWSATLKKLSREFSVVVALSILSLYFYFLMEWIFFATKPSFMSSFGMSAKISALVVPPGLFSIAFICAIGLLRLSSGAIKSTLGVNIFSRTAPILPALPMAACLFVLVDTFTYTLVDYGVIFSDGWARLLYGAWFLFLLLVSYLFFYRKTVALASSTSPRSLTVLAGVLLLISAADAVHTLAGTTRSSNVAINSRTHSDRLPNILLISSDGIDASNVSAYGYERDTTPFLRSKIDEALLFENAFTNAPDTRPSLASMFTGKLPTTTRLLTISGILQGEHAYQHLPGILRNLGYESMDIVFHSVGGAFNFNLRNSFDVSGSRTIQWQKFSLPGSLSVVFANAEFMIGEILDRLRGRLLHVFFVEKMVDEFEELTHARHEFLPASADDVRLTALYDFIETASEPFLVHVHFMGTHGPKFSIEKPEFSRDQEQTEQWMDDFYDDSILQFDGYVEEMFRRLDRAGKLDNSIIVINTDHSRGKEHSRTHARLPLVAFFPNHEPSGRIKSSVQLLDLAPTLLDYLDVDKPDWMEGDSVLRGEPDPLRRIVSVYALRGESRQIYLVQVVVCNRIYLLNFPSKSVYHHPVEGHTTPCVDLDLPDNEEVYQFILEHLQSRGIDLTRDVRQTR